jgi:TIR domain/NB-ARC domain
MLSLPMLPSAPSRIFISYARKDGAALAQRLQSDLTKKGLDAWLDTQRLRGGATWTKEIETVLDQANYVLVLLTQSSYISEICRSEQLRALRKGTCVIPIKAQYDTDIPLHLEAKNYRDFSDASHYDAQFKILLEDIGGNISATLPKRYRETPVRYLTAPPRVSNYLERPEAVRALRATLFSEDHRQPIALTALAGMGGIGKTVLAKALTDDPVVQHAFPDGIVWINVGREKKQDFTLEMREVAKVLSDDLSLYDNRLASSLLSQWFVS